MGNKISRRRDTLKSAESAATEDPADAQQAEEPEAPRTQEAAEEEDLDVVVGEPVTEVACLPSGECTSDMKPPKTTAATPDADDDVETETPAPKSGPVEEPQPVAAAQLAPEPELTPNPQVEADVAPGPISEPGPGPAEDLEQTDMLTQEAAPQPVISSSALVDLGVAVTLQPVIAPIHSPVHADKPLDVTLAEECQGDAQAAESSTPEPEKPGEMSECLEEAGENLLVGDVNEDSVSALLKNLELHGNDLVTDLIPSDVKMPDETPSADVCSSAELM
ncbi:protein TsetseEP-like [Betta splendens]|uniref:Protein TsetseEP-like n=1 Tax=Betta splendens TaxID=158456 RepID=A0A6P7MVT4_BETSP|nr:protein TsetseEP-like [Betta splendens]